jgi:hypothetical protein
MLAAITSALRTQLSWTHYKSLLGLDNSDKREYYISKKNNGMVLNSNEGYGTQ